MNEDLTLGSLAESLKKKKNEALEESQAIKKESLDDFKKALTEYMHNELHTIEEDITRRTRNLQKKLSGIRKEMYEEEKVFMQTLQEERSQIEGEIRGLSVSLTKLRTKQWIIPTVIGLGIVIGLAIGSWSIGKWISNQYQEISELSLEIADQKKELEKIKRAKGKYTIKAWSNAIGVKKKPEVSRGRDMWIIQFEKSKGE